ncbi:MAG: hypothetical protein B7X55_09875, partial [Rhodobacterales bacterium 34-62-10]
GRQLRRAILHRHLTVLESRQALDAHRRREGQPLGCEPERGMRQIRGIQGTPIDIPVETAGIAA